MIATKPVHARKLSDLVSSCNSSVSRSRAESTTRDASEATTASRSASNAKSRSSEGKLKSDPRSASASASAASTPKKARGVQRPPKKARAVVRNRPTTTTSARGSAQGTPNNHQEVVNTWGSSAARSEQEAVDIAQEAIASQGTQPALERASSAPTNDDIMPRVTNAEVMAEGRLSAEATPETTEVISVEEDTSFGGDRPVSPRAHLDVKADEDAETSLRRSRAAEATESGSAATSQEATTPEERSEEGASPPVRLADSNEGDEATSVPTSSSSSDVIPPPPPPGPYLLPPKSEWPDFPVRASRAFTSYLC